MPLHRSDFHYDLPLYLIAQQPAAVRSESQLLCLDPLRDARMTDLPGLLEPGDLLVFNDTRVIPARLFGEKDSGGKVEILVERLLGERELLAQVRARQPPTAGSRLGVADAAADRERYQTLFARQPGAVAAPTAGLHFDQALLDAIRARGVDTGFVTLHVGAGTFQPVRVDDISKHKMHRERYTVGPVLCEQIAAA